jgi:hypothetical protein
MAPKEKGRPAGGDPIPKKNVCQDDQEFISQPAELQEPPDVTGEDDWAYFRRRPGAVVRVRLPFPREFPDDFLEHDGGTAFFVRIAVSRDAAGEPVWGARSVTRCQGGRA